MSKKLINKLEKDRVGKKKPSVSSTIQTKRPITTNTSQARPMAGGHDVHQMAETSWQRILDNRDQLAGEGSKRPIIQTKLTLGPAGDQYEQEADSVAKQVVSNLNNVQGQPTQRAEDEEMLAKRIQREEDEDMQMKPISTLQRADDEEMLAKRIQREEDEDMQMKPISTLQRADDEEMLAKRIQREEDEDMQMKPISTLQRADDEEMLAKRIQREEDEDMQMKPISTLQRADDEEMLAKRIQREEDEDMQMKPVSMLQREEDEEMLAKRIQREGDEDMLAKSTDDTSAGGPVSEGLESQIQSAKGGGQPMGDEVRGSMEQAFGADFSGVRVHTGAQSDTLNQSIQARAFTTGQDIFFRSGEYNPGSSCGQELLAHELTHVVQQNGNSVQRQDRTIQRAYDGVWLDMDEMQREKKAKPSLHIPKKYKKGGGLKNKAKRFSDAFVLIGREEPQIAAQYLSHTLDGIKDQLIIDRDYILNKYTKPKHGALRAKATTHYQKWIGAINDMQAYLGTNRDEALDEFSARYGRTIADFEDMIGI